MQIERLTGLIFFAKTTKRLLESMGEVSQSSHGLKVWED